MCVYIYTYICTCNVLCMYVCVYIYIDICIENRHFLIKRFTDGADITPDQGLWAKQRTWCMWNRWWLGTHGAMEISSLHRHSGPKYLWYWGIELHGYASYCSVQNTCTLKFDPMVCPRLLYLDASCFPIFPEIEHLTLGPILRITVRTTLKPSAARFTDLISSEVNLRDGPVTCFSEPKRKTMGGYGHTVDPLRFRPWGITPMVYDGLWNVYFMENPTNIWMRTGGTPMTSRKQAIWHGDVVVENPPPKDPDLVLESIDESMIFCCDLWRVVVLWFVSALEHCHIHNWLVVWLPCCIFPLILGF